MRKVFISIIDQEMIVCTASGSFVCPALPALRVGLEMDWEDFGLVAPYLELDQLQSMAQKVANIFSRELQWAVEQHDYALHSLDPQEQTAEYQTIHDELRHRCLELRARCEKTIREVVMKELKLGDRSLPASQSEYGRGAARGRAASPMADAGPVQERLSA